MDDKDIFVTLEANLIEAVKRLVQNARNELDTRRKGKPQGSGAKPAGGAAKQPAAKPAENKNPATKPAESPAKEPAKPAEPPKELGSMMDVFASILPVAEDTPSPENAEGSPATPTPETTEEQAKQKQIDELMMEIDPDLHGMKHLTAERPKARRKTQAVGTGQKFDPSATILPDPVPVVVALVPEPTEQERKVAAGPRQPVVHLGDLQKRGGGRGGGPGRGGGAAGGRRETLGNSQPEKVAAKAASDGHKVEPKPGGEAHKDKGETHKDPPKAEGNKTEGPKSPQTDKEPASPPPEVPKVPALPPEETAPELEAPPLPSLPVTPLSPFRMPSTDTLEPEQLSLDARRNSGAAPPLPSLPADTTTPHPTPVAVKRPGPPPGGPSHVPGPPRAMSPVPRKASTVTPPTQLAPPEQDEVPPAIPTSPVDGETANGEAAPPPEPEKKLSAVMTAARAKQPAINLADIMKPRTPKADVPKPAAAAAPSGPTIPNCGECGCSKFVMNPFKKGTNCSTCFHLHPAPG